MEENKEYREVQKEVSEEELEKYWSIVSDTDENKPEKFKKEYQLKKAVEVLCNALREDKSEGSYYHSWMRSIKMAMYDAMRDNGNIKDFNKEIILNMCEDGAKNFLNLLISK